MRSPLVMQALTCRVLDTNYYEKALFVKVDLATALWWIQRLSALRALCFYSHSR
jgi:hypothetical protein